MRVGIDLSCWSNARGYGRYTRNLLQACLALDSRHEYVGFADPATVAAGDFPARLEVVTVPVTEAPAQAAAAEGRRRLQDVWRMSRAVQRACPQVMFFPSSYTYFPVLGKTHCVIVVHDAIAERMPALIFPTRAGRLAWNLKTRLACWQAHRVVTVSRVASAAIQQHLPIRSDRIRVIYEAPDPIFRVRDSDTDRGRQRSLLERHAIPTDARVVLYVGGFGPHKNVGALVEAFEEVNNRADVPLHLVLVGKTVGEVFHSEIEDLQARVRQLGIERAVTFTGFVPDDELVDFYNLAACLVLPSRDEGFGLPVIEAMACGTPVIANRVGAMSELVSETAGLLVDVERPGELSASLRRLAFSTPAQLTELGRGGMRRAAELTWDKAAMDLLAVFDELDTTSRQSPELSSRSWGPCV